MNVVLAGLKFNKRLGNEKKRFKNTYLQLIWKPNVWTVTILVDNEEIVWCTYIFSGFSGFLSSRLQFFMHFIGLSPHDWPLALRNGPGGNGYPSYIQSLASASAAAAAAAAAHAQQHGPGSGGAQPPPGGPVPPPPPPPLGPPSGLPHSSPLGSTTDLVHNHHMLLPSSDVSPASSSSHPPNQSANGNGNSSNINGGIKRSASSSSSTPPLKSPSNSSGGGGDPYLSSSSGGRDGGKETVTSPPPPSSSSSGTGLLRASSLNPAGGSEGGLLPSFDLVKHPSLWAAGGFGGLVGNLGSKFRRMSTLFCMNDSLLLKKYLFHRSSSFTSPTPLHPLVQQRVDDNGNPQRHE